MNIAAPKYKHSLARRGLPLVAILLSTSGCVLQTTGKEGTRHYIVLGAGIVSIPSPEASPPVTVAKLQAVGLAAEWGPSGHFALGYINSHHIAVDPNSDTTVQMSDVIGGPVTVSTSTTDSQEQDP
jgi:hypothetical protein